MDFRENNLNLNSNDILTPKGIRLTSINDSSNSIVISWYTEGQASDPKVEYSIESTLIDHITIIPTLKYINGTYIYSSNLKNLEPNETYYYQISSDVYNKREILNFTTSPTRNATSIKFLVVGDTQKEGDATKELLNKIVGKFNNIDFTVHLGDIVEDGRIQGQWNKFFDDYEPITKKTLGYYIEGNHDCIDGYMYDNIFLPSNGNNSDFYSFNIGSISFIGLNNFRENITTTTMATWLESELKKTENDNYTLWRFVYMHRPLFSSHTFFSDLTNVIPVWCPLFEEYGVDIVFAGHLHYYERSYPMNQFKNFDGSSKYNFIDPSNPMYFISGGGGGTLTVGAKHPSYVASYLSTYHFIFVKIDVDNIKKETILTLETWAMPNDYNNIYLIDNITIVKKEILININYPNKNQVFGHKAPEYNITVEKKMLKSSWYSGSINTTWYTIDNAITNFTFTDLSGTINQIAWENQTNDFIKIIFYVNDSLGNIYENNIFVQKDIIPPNITIISPTPNQFCRITAPTFNIQIIEPNLQEKRYSLNGRPNITFTTEIKFNQTEWNQVGNGTVSITFYAIDKVGNIISSEVIVRKDAYVPDIIINSPLDKQKFGKTAPDFNISIIEEDLVSTWYIIEGIVGTFTFTGLPVAINQDAWDDASEGEITITFYALDRAGNMGSERVVVIKSIPSKLEFPGYNLFLLLGFLVVISILISKKVKNN
ncbi:MAG: purple acid phosphatase family protein [Promethearchaeota archaeon]